MAFQVVDQADGEFGVQEPSARGEADGACAPFEPAGLDGSAEGLGEYGFDVDAETLAEGGGVEAIDQAEAEGGPIRDGGFEGVVVEVGQTLTPWPPLPPGGRGGRGGRNAASCFFRRSI
jgi:hypothetical protein